MKLSIVIPWLDRGDSDRRRTFEYVRGYYESLGVGEVVVGTYEDDGGPFNLARCRNNGARAAAGEVLMFVDADMLVPGPQILAAADDAAAHDGAVLPFDTWRCDLTPEQSQLVFNGAAWEDFVIERPSYFRDGEIPEEWWRTACVMVSRSTYTRVGGYDERFYGWSPEDHDFLAGCHLIYPLRAVPGVCAQLSHTNMFTAATTEGTPAHEAFTRGTQLGDSKKAHLRSEAEWAAETSKSRALAALPRWFYSSNFEMLREMSDRPLVALQVGAYTGDASRWLLDNVLTHEKSVLVDVDTFAGSDDEFETIDWGLVETAYYTTVRDDVERGKVQVFRGTSDDFFATHDTQDTFDIIYIDGSHHAEQVLQDARNAHRALRDGGILAFDDYEWRNPGRDPLDVPHTAIDQFLAETPGYQKLAVNTQMWLQKNPSVRVAVYAPMKNERDNIREWVESAVDADEIVLTDTGSTDGSFELALLLMQEFPNLRVERAWVTPWRFDDGFNAAMMHVSDDIDVCVPLHLDERLGKGWREILEDGWRAGGRRFTFYYEWGADLHFRLDRIHARNGFRWRYPAHETLEGAGPRLDLDLRIVQNRDLSKDRSQDEGLIHLMLQESPDDPRAQYYSAREHNYHNEWAESRRKFLLYLANPAATFDQERAEACRYMARMVWPADKERWLLRACYEAPQRRECWADLAAHYRDTGSPLAAAGAAERALSITERTAANSFHLESTAWNDDTLKQMMIVCGSVREVDL